MATAKPRPTKDCRHPTGSSCPACSWRVEWRRGGRTGSRESCTFPTQRLAESAARLIEARQHKITDVEVYAAVAGIQPGGAADLPPTVTELAERWITRVQDAGGNQPDTIADKRRILKRHILPHLGDLPVTSEALGDDTIVGWVKWMRSRPSARGGTLDADTIRRAHEVLRSLLGSAVPRWLATNPAARLATRGIELPKSTVHEPLFLLPAELARIEACCDEWIADMVYVDARTGLRLGELLTLQVEHVVVSGNRKRIMVRRALKRDGTIGAPKSRRSRRDVSISSEVADRLAPRVKGRASTALVFTAPGGGMWHPSNLRQRHWLPALAEAQRCPEHPPLEPPKPARGPRRKLRADEVSTCECPGRLHRVPRWHDLRHTHVGLCAEAGWELIRVSRRVGHDKIDTTMNIYGHLWDLESDDRLDAVEKLLLVASDEAA